MYLLNGESKQSIECSDRGFQYGDGLFETIEVLNSTPVFLQQHLQRLIDGCHKLLLPIPDKALLRKEAFEITQSSKRAVLKLIYTRGSGGRGYRQPETAQPTRLFSLHPSPEYPENYSQVGITARFCNNPLGLNPSLAGIKHLNRLEQVIACAEWDDVNIQEGIMLDINEQVIEGTMSNLFLIKDDVLYTPRIDNCGVKGVLRDIVISIAHSHHIKVVEKEIGQQDVLLADELFITNSIIGIWPIKQLEQQHYNTGNITKKLQQLFLQIKQKDIEKC